MNELMKSVSGIRGIFGTAITPANVMQFVSHFGNLQKRRYKKDTNIIKIVVGRDSRTTGEALAYATISSLLSVGVDVVWLGIVATPTLLLSVKELGAQGGICITASHNPAEWNAMKFIDANGMFLFPEVMNEFLSVLEKEVDYANWDSMGQKIEDFEASYRHIQKILSINYLDLKKIRQKKFKVVLDSVNGAGGVISPTLLKELGCEVIEINCEPTGHFAHTPEPLNKNLNQICAAVKEHKADIGFATDPDVDRLAIIDEKGNCVGEEFSLLLTEKFVLSHKKGDIVTNLSSSMASEDIAKEFGVNVIRTKVGEINVGKTMKEINSPIGGEGNGGIICPEVNYTRDAVAGMALILGYMAQRNMKISELACEIPRYYFAKNKIETSQDKLNQIMLNTEKLYQSEKIDKTDGIKIIFDRAWAHVRKSGTEPIIRVYTEAETEEKAEKLCQEVIEKISS